MPAFCIWPGRLAPRCGGTAKQARWHLASAGVGCIQISKEVNSRSERILLRIAHRLLPLFATLHIAHNCRWRIFLFVCLSWRKKTSTSRAAQTPETTSRTRNTNTKINNKSNRPDAMSSRQTKKAALAALRERRAGLSAASSKLEEYCLLYTSPSPRDAHESRMPSSA